MNTTPILRPATVADAGLIIQITRSAWTGRVDPGSSAFRETEAEIAEQIAEGGGFILSLEQTPVGSVRYSPVPDAWEVRRMGVLPEYRGKGFALAMMNAVVDHALCRGINELRLAVRYDQPRLLAFYAGMGFELAPNLKYAHQSPGSVAPTVMRRSLRV
jgi:GNAT superfamily N-acetyltransferase